jgi:hypothetical protein
MSINKILVSAAIVLGASVGIAAPASADPNPASAGTNPFGALSCSCRETAPADSPVLKDEIHRGIREGLSVLLPGLPHRPGPDNGNAGAAKS